MQYRRIGATGRRSLVPEPIVRFLTSTNGFIQKHLFHDRSPRIKSILRFLHASFHLVSAMDSMVDLYFRVHGWPKSVDEEFKATLILTKVTFDFRRATHLFNFSIRPPNHTLDDFDCLHHQLCALLLLLKIQYFVFIILYGAEFKGLELITFLEKVTVFDCLFFSIISIRLTTLTHNSEVEM